MEYVKNVIYTEYLTVYRLDDGEVDITINANLRENYRSFPDKHDNMTLHFESALKSILEIRKVAVTSVKFLTAARQKDCKIYKVTFKRV
jgi:hypothetical protein